MSSVPLAPKAVDHTFRRKWDKAEYTAKANELGIKSVSDAALALDAAATAPKAVLFEQDRTTAMARTADLQLDANVGQRAEVADAKRAGFYCVACDRAEKDSSSWLDHLNSVRHQKNTGTALRAERSSLDDVNERLRELKRTALHAFADDDAHGDDAALDEAEFEARLERMRQTDEQRLAEKRAKKRAKKKALRDQQRTATTDGDDDAGDADGDEPSKPTDDAANATDEAADAAALDEEAAMAAMMGLPVGFASKHRR